MIVLLFAGLALAAAPTLVEARPVRLQQAHLFQWSASSRPVQEGVVLVLGVDPAEARPRQGPHPVLYVGETPAERLSWSSTAPYLVVFAPGPVDLSTTPVYWGDERLPEQVDAAHGRAQLAAAEARGATPFAAEALSARTGAPLQVADSAAFVEAVAPIVEKWAPLPAP